MAASIPLLHRAPSSSNNIFYIQIHYFTQKTMLNQSLYCTIQYLQPNTKSRGNNPLGSRCRKNSFVARGLRLCKKRIIKATFETVKRRIKSCSYNDLNVLAEDPFTARWSPAQKEVPFKRTIVDRSDQEYKTVIANMMSHGGEDWTEKVKLVQNAVFLLVKYTKTLRF